MKLKLGIIGTRGIPNQYGGFEQFAQYLSLDLAAKGHNVFVYNPHNHSYKEKQWKGVNIIHCYDPEKSIGTAGQFIYDLNCIRDARKRDFDILLFLGYTSSSIWHKLYPKKTLIISNMDGLEWKRSKYSKKVQQFLLYAEKLAVKHSHFHVADSIGMQQYLKENYNLDSKYIAYGADPFNTPDKKKIRQYGLEPYGYDMLMARMEPENSIETILDGYCLSSGDRKFVVLGNTSNKFGQYILNKFAANTNIFFLGAIYDQDIINNLRYYSNLYFHGHSVGGTNPSLLEAMANHALVAAHNNIFNKAILKDDGLYFSNSDEVAKILTKENKNEQKKKVENSFSRIDKDFNWEKICREYEAYFIQCYKQYHHLD